MNTTAPGASVLPVLSAQLRDTAAQVEQAVVVVSSSFDRMVGVARETVALAARALHDGEEGDTGMAAATAAARTTLERLLDRLEDNSRLSAAAIDRVAKIEGDLEQIIRILDDVDRMARGTRLLALNAAIEAARFGSQGKAFGVVAKEIQEMASLSQTTSGSIRRIVQELTRDVSRAAVEWRELASGETDDAQASRREVEQALGSIATAGERMQLTIQAASANAEELTAQIGAAVTGLQFQDAVNQRLTHVVQALDALEMARREGGHEQREAPGTPGGECPAASLDALASSYTMGAEREAHSRLGGWADQGGASKCGSVELF